MRLRTFTVICAMLTASVCLYGQNNPLLGTWKLNLAKTNYSGGPPPKEIVEKFEASGPNGIKYTQDRVNADGQKQHNEFTTTLDGKISPYKGAGRDSVSVRRIDPYTYRVSYLQKGEPLQTNYWIVSKDGKNLTTHSTNLTDDKQVYHRLVVFDKQ